MKKLLSIFFILFVARITFGQTYPIKQNLGSTNTLVVPGGALEGRIILYAYPDTASANLENIKNYPGALILIGDAIYHRSSDAKRWILGGSMGSAINNGLLSIGGMVLVDSTLTIQHNVVWSINGISHTRVTDTSFIIHTADSGYYRRDLIYADSTIHILQGVPDTLIAITPTFPTGAINVTVVDVYGAQILPPNATIIGAIPNLQQTTNQGDTTTNPIIVNNNSSGTSVQINGDFNRSYYYYGKNKYSGRWSNVGAIFKNDVADDPNDEHTGHFLQMIMGSTNSDFMPDGGLIRTNGLGGLKFSADSGRIAFGKGAPFQPQPWVEFGAFEPNGDFGLRKVDSSNVDTSNIAFFDANGIFKRGHLSSVGKSYTDSIAATKTQYVADIPALQAYAGSANTAIVQDSTRGGLFMFKTTGTSNNGTVFAATGKGSGYWQRVFSGRVNVKWFGTDSTAFKSWFAYLIATKNNGYIPAGTYTMSGGQFLMAQNASVLPGVDIEGAGVNSTILKVLGNFSGKAVFDLSSTKFMTLHDFSIQNVDNTGTAIILNKDNTFVHEVTYSNLNNISIYNFDTSIYVGAGQDVNIKNLNATNANTGLILGLNNVFNLDNSVIVAKDTGVVITGGSNTILSNSDFESSPVGVVLHSAGSFQLLNDYWEANNKYSILAAPNSSDFVSSLSIKNPALSLIDSSLVNNVGRFELESTPSRDANSKTNLRITNNVKSVAMKPQMLFTLVNPEYVSDGHRGNESAFPYYFTDFRSFSQPSWTTANVYLDTTHNVYAYVNHSGTIKDTTDYLTGGRSMIFKADSGFIGSDFVIQFQPNSIPDGADYLNATYTCKYNLADTIGHGVNANIVWKDTSNVTHVYQSFSSNGALATYRYMLGKWVTSYVPFDLKTFKANVGSAFSSILYLQINLIVTNNTVTTGGNEAITIDNIALYPSKYANNIYTDNLNAVNQKYLNHPRYLQVDNQAILPSNTSIGVISSAVINYLSGVTSNIQDQLNGTVHISGTETITGAKTFSATTNFSNVIASNTYQAGNGYGYYFGSSATRIIGSNTAGYMDFYTNNSLVMELNSNGFSKYYQKVRYSTNQTMTAADSLVFVPKKYIDSLLKTKADTGTVKFITTKGIISDTISNPGYTTLSIDSAYVIDSIMRNIQGTYTPTITGIANYAAGTASVCQYSKTGKTVTIWGKVTVQPTAAATITTFSLSLPTPVTTTFTSSYEAAGTGGGIFSSVYYPYVISSASSGSTLNVSFISNQTSGQQDCQFHVTYQIQ